MCQGWAVVFPRCSVVSVTFLSPDCQRRMLPRALSIAKRCSSKHTTSQKHGKGSFLRVDSTIVVFLAPLPLFNFNILTLRGAIMMRDADSLPLRPNSRANVLDKAKMMPRLATLSTCLKLGLVRFNPHQSRAYCTTAAPKATSAPSQKQQAAQPTISNLDIRVGRIVQVERHPQADTLYVEKIDVGEPEPRTIISGLVKYMKEDELKDRLVLVLCNLPAKAMRGIASNGMVLASSITSESGEATVKLIDPPSGCVAGEVVSFADEVPQIIPSISGNRLEKILKRCKVNGDGIATFTTQDGRELAFQTQSGSCTSTLSNSSIS